VREAVWRMGSPAGEGGSVEDGQPYRGWRRCGGWAALQVKEAVWRTAALQVREVV
jgi:hypothetical protein